MRLTVATNRRAQPGGRHPAPGRQMGSWVETTMRLRTIVAGGAGGLPAAPSRTSLVLGTKLQRRIILLQRLKRSG